MQGIDGLASLTDLDLDVRVPERGVRHLASLSALERLSLTGPIPADDLPHLSSLPRLRTLELRDVDVTAAGLEGLAASATLEQLSLVRCRFDPGALPLFAPTTKLQSFGIRQSDFRTEDLQPLISSRPNLSIYVDWKDVPGAR
jgi:hypothetical protein